MEKDNETSDTTFNPMNEDVVVDLVDGERVDKTDVVDEDTVVNTEGAKDVNVKSVSKDVEEETVDDKAKTDVVDPVDGKGVDDKAKTDVVDVKPVDDDAKTEPVDEEEITLQSMGGATYKVLTKEEAMDVDPSLLHKMIRPNNTKCFTLKNGVETKQVEKKGVLSKLSSLNPFKGGKLKTKKRRVTKKRNQKKGFKSRSKK